MLWFACAREYRTDRRVDEISAKQDEKRGNFDRVKVTEHPSLDQVLATRAQGWTANHNMYDNLDMRIPIRSFQCWGCRRLFSRPSFVPQTLWILIEPM